MSNVLKSFLIGIGFDTSNFDAGIRDVDRGMSEIKGSALKTSAALVGAFGAMAGSIVHTASKVDQLALKTSNMRASTQYVYNYGNALKMLGGDASEAITAVSAVEEILTNLHIKGQTGALDDLILAGIDISKIQYTTNAEDFMGEIAKQAQGLNKEQRSILQKSLGLSDAALVSMTQGYDKYQSGLQQAEGMTGNLDNLTENSRKLMANASQFSLVIEGVTNELAEKFMPSLIGVSTWVNDFLTSNRGSISDAIQYASDNAQATASIGLGATLATLGAGLSKIGLSTVGGAATKTGTFGVALGASAIGADVLNESLGKYVPGYQKASQGFDNVLKDVTGLDRIKSPMEVIFGGTPEASVPRPAPSAPGDEWWRSVVPQRRSSGVSGGWDPVVEPIGEDAARQVLTPDAGLTPNEMPRGETTNAARVQEERQAATGAIIKAFGQAPIRVDNRLTIMLDGQALEYKIVTISEQVAHNTLTDVATTTAR